MRLPKLPASCLQNTLGLAARPEPNLMRYNRQLYFSAFTTADAVVSTQIPTRSLLVGAWVSWYIADAAANGVMYTECSLLAVSQFTVNDAENVLFTIRSESPSVQLVRTDNLYIPIGVILDAGQRIYLHRFQITAPDTYTVSANLIFQ